MAPSTWWLLTTFTKAAHNRLTAKADPQVGSVAEFSGFESHPNSWLFSLTRLADGNSVPVIPLAGDDEHNMEHPSREDVHHGNILLRLAGSQQHVASLTHKTCRV